MTPRWRVRASPATADRKASTLVLTGGAVSYSNQRKMMRSSITIYSPAPVAVELGVLGFYQQSTVSSVYFIVWLGYNL